ncbi:hypothetical protein V1508DRAFT_400176 [Lipomyces doorenjongii]|uniref:uncharacterized protein n=1 Tax=Lipomyces doorenjongii TaxID=383834 RepID=UPI0034CFEBC4
MPYSSQHSLRQASYIPHPALACLMRFRTIYNLPPMNPNSPTAIQATSTLGKAKRAGRDGSQNFSLQEKMALLDAIEMVKPLGPANGNRF